MVTSEINIRLFFKNKASNYEAEASRLIDISNLTFDLISSQVDRDVSWCVQEGFMAFQAITKRKKSRCINSCPRLSGRQICDDPWGVSSRKTAGRLMKRVEVTTKRPRNRITS